MRTAVLGLLLAVGVAGAAQAADYVIVSSTDPALKPGLEISGGQRVSLGAGQTARIMSASGAISMLRGGASGAVVPAAGGAADAGKLAQLKVLIDPPPQSRTFGARRSGVCPDPATLTTIDQILAVQSGGCAAQARTALETYLAAH